MASSATVHLDSILHTFELSDISISNFIIFLLKNDSFRKHACTKDLVAHSTLVMDAFLSHPGSSKSMWDWANNIVKRKYAAAIQDLADKDNGWHFGALHASESKLQEFQIENMATRMQQLAPELWDMLGLMLSANRQEMLRTSSPDGEGDQSMKDLEDTGDEDDEYWKDLEGLYVEEDELEGIVPKAHDPQRMAKRHEALITIVSTPVKIP
jgi:hypothetical protein